MKVEKRDGAVERQLTIGLVVDTALVGRVEPQWTPRGLFRSRWANLVGGWAVDYFRKTGSAPGRNIQTMFDEWAAGTTADKDTVALVERFLESLSDEYEAIAKEVNGEYLADVAFRHFNVVAGQQLAEALLADAEAGDADKIVKRVETFGKVELGAGAGVHLFRDPTVLQRAFEFASQPILTYPGAAGEFYGDLLERDAFVAYLAPPKAGKTHHLTDLAYRLLLESRKVAFFAVGDMTERQIVRRFAVRGAKHPLKARTVPYPRKIARDHDGQVFIEYDDKVFDKPLTWRRADRLIQTVLEKRLRTDEVLFKLSVHPNSSLTVAGMDAVLRGWERQGWTPDAVVVDYADILAPPAGARDLIEQTTVNWRQLRRLSQKWHCLVATATQTNAAAYNGELLSRKHFSGSKAVLAEVTGMIGINRYKSEDRDQNIVRLNWVVAREGELPDTKCVYVATCYALGNCCVRSTW